MTEEFYKAWYFLQEHPAFIADTGFDGFVYQLSIDVVKVDPKTKRIDDDESKNTKIQIWLEGGKWEKHSKEIQKTLNQIGSYTHDIRLDCGGDTFEEAIIELAKLVKKYYGTYKSNNQ